MADLDFEKSCKTVVLKTSDLFFSAFPGKIVFGDVIEQNYPEFKYFQFFHFEIFNLYLALVAIIKNIVNNSQEESENKGIIIKFNGIHSNHNKLYEVLRLLRLLCIIKHYYDLY